MKPLEHHSLFKRATLLCFAAGALLTAMLTGLLRWLLVLGLEQPVALVMVATAAAAIALAGVALIARIDRSWRTRLAALETAASHFRSFFDLNPEPAFHLTPAGEITGANRQAALLTGYSMSELAGRNLAELAADAAHRSAFEAALSDARAGEATAPELTLNRRDGEPVEVSLSIQPVVREGRATVMLAIARESREQAAGALAVAGGEEIYRLLFDHSLDGILLTNPDGRIYAANAAACRILRQSEQGVRESGWAEILDSDDARIPTMVEARTHDGCFSGELRFRRGDGKIIPVEVSIADYRSEDSREWSGIVFRDLSMRKAASDEMRLLRTCIAHLNDAVVVTEATPLRLPGPRIVFVNQAFERLTGFTAEEAIGATPRIVQGPETDGAVLARIRERLGRGLAVREELVNYRKTGETYTASVEITPIFDEFGVNTHFVAIERDVSTARAMADRLEEAEQRYRALFDLNPDPAYLVDVRGRFISVNRKTAELAGYDESEMARMPFSQLIAIEDHERVFDHFHHNRRGLAQFCAVTGIRKDGSRRRIEIATAPLFVRGKITGIFGIAKDVTDIKRTEEELRLAAKALSNIGEATLITDPDWNIVSVNQAFTSITGFSGTEAIGRPLPELGTHTEGGDYYTRMSKRLLHSGHWQGELWLQRKSGDRFPAMASLNTVNDDAGNVTHFVSVFNDISYFKRCEQRLEFLAHNDPLTHLPNRRLFEKKAVDALARAQRHKQVLGLLFIDLDQFKAVNDSLGHTVGDALIKLVGERLRGLVRATDTLARIGGDEFIVILEELRDSKDAALVADSLLKALARPFAHEGHELFTSASIGISCYPEDGTDIDTLLRNADAAMYRAKELGRNAYEFFSAELNARAHDYLFIANSLHQALEREEFRLHYQPIVDLANYSIRGAEALIRWQHPELGLIPPERFIPIAEATGMIGIIGEWVLETACRQACEWQSQGLPSIPVSVNLSARQFRRPELLDTIKRALHDSGLPSHRLRLEITESLVMDQPERSREMLRALHAIGVRTAIDDFGTGYSSLNSLKQFPFDCLKIDRSFISGIPRDEDDIAIIRAILSLAQHLKLEVVAEGVETQAQREFLLRLGCANAQGFLFTPPLPPADFETALAHGRHAFEPATA